MKCLPHVRLPPINKGEASTKSNSNNQSSISHVNLNNYSMSTPIKPTKTPINQDESMDSSKDVFLLTGLKKNVKFFSGKKSSDEIIYNKYPRVKPFIPQNKLTPFQKKLLDDLYSENNLKLNAKLRIPKYVSLKNFDVKKYQVDLLDEMTNYFDFSSVLVLKKKFKRMDNILEDRVAMSNRWIDLSERFTGLFPEKLMDKLKEVGGSKSFKLNKAKELKKAKSMIIEEDKTEEEKKIEKEKKKKEQKAKEEEEKENEKFEKIKENLNKLLKRNNSLMIEEEFQRRVNMIKENHFDLVPIHACKNNNNIDK